MARILIVDDSPVLRRSLRRVLEAEVGITVCAEASNGREAIETARDSNPDLIVLDLSMPVMNGLDAAPHLKHLLPAVPIVMFSSFDSSWLLELAQAAGIATVVGKESPERLVVAIRTLVRAAA